MKEPRRALLIADKTSRPSYEPRHGETPTGRHFVRKPNPNNGRQAHRERPSRGLATLREGPAAASRHTIRRIGLENDAVWRQAVDDAAAAFAVEHGLVHGEEGVSIDGPVDVVVCAQEPVEDRAGSSCSIIIPVGPLSGRMPPTLDHTSGRGEMSLTSSYFVIPMADAPCAGMRKPARRRATCLVSSN
jgi:hypothetical protein